MSEESDSDIELLDDGFDSEDDAEFPENLTAAYNCFFIVIRIKKEIWTVFFIYVLCDRFKSKYSRTIKF